MWIKRTLLSVNEASVRTHRHSLRTPCVHVVLFWGQSVGIPSAPDASVASACGRGGSSRSSGDPGLPPPAERGHHRGFGKTEVSSSAPQKGGSRHKPNTGRELLTRGLFRATVRAFINSDSFLLLMKLASDLELSTRGKAVVPSTPQRPLPCSFLSSQ